MTTPALPHICATCGEPLNYSRQWSTADDEQQRWVHGVPTDHEPAPIPRTETDETNIRPICDFCTGPVDRETGWLYTTMAFTLHGEDDRSSLTAEDDGDGWIACDRCRTLIEQNQRDLLVARSVSIASRRTGENPDTIIDWLRQAQELFFLGKRGDGYPVREYRA